MRPDVAAAYDRMAAAARAKKPAVSGLLRTPAVRRGHWRHRGAI
jgi:hypothetical protein